MIRTVAATAAFLFSICTANSWAQLGGAVQSKPNANAVSGPSLEETQKWISDNFDKASGGERLFFFEGCTAIALKKEHDAADRYDLAEKFSMGDVTAKLGEYSQDSLILMEKISQSRNKPHVERKFYISFHAINQKLAFAYAYESVDRKCTGQCFSVADRLNQVKTYYKTHQFSGDIGGNLDSYLMAERIANAFNHAQKLCKKKELDAQSSKAAEDYSRNARKPGELF